MIKLTRTAIRRLHLHKQGLYHPPQGATPAEALALLRRLGCVQLDTMNVLTRSQHLVFWARMAHFQEEWLLDFYRQGLVAERYLHALCLLPADEERYFAFSAARYQTRLQQEATPEHRRLMQELHTQLLRQGLLTSREAAAHAQDQGGSRGIWEQSPVQRALEDLWRCGLARMERDEHFRKRYRPAAPERAEEPLPAEACFRRYVHLALQAIGAATEADLAGYFRFRRVNIRPALQTLLQEGAVRQVQGEAEQAPYWVLTEDLDLLASPALAEAPTQVALLSPFDNLIWYRPRLERLWGIHFRLESYVPREQRQFGYFSLPMLMQGEIVGTVDLKADRQAQRLLVQQLVFFEPERAPDYLPALEMALDRLMTALRLQSIGGI